MERYGQGYDDIGISNKNPIMTIFSNILTHSYQTKMESISLTLLFYSLIISCGQPSVKDKIENKVTTPLLMQNAVICDTCVCQLKVSFKEYTGSLDFAVDTGTVYISSKLFKSMNDILNLDSTMQRPLNTIDFNFADNNDFEKLWTHSTRYTTGWNDYIVSGRVCGFNYAKRDYFSRWQLELVFCMKDFKKLN